MNTVEEIRIWRDEEHAQTIQHWFFCLLVLLLITPDWLLLIIPEQDVLIWKQKQKKLQEKKKQCEKQRELKQVEKLKMQLQQFGKSGGKSRARHDQRDEQDVSTKSTSRGDVNARGEMEAELKRQSNV